MPRTATALSGLLVLVAALALVVTVYVLGGAFGLYSVVVGGSALPVADLSSLAVAGGTLFLGTATALLTLSTRAAAAETRDEARLEREAGRARLDITFDKDSPVLWATGVGYARVMVVNNGEAMAHHVVVALETIELHNPMLDAQFQVPNGPLRNGNHVLPSKLQWKGMTIDASTSWNATSIRRLGNSSMSWTSSGTTTARRPFSGLTSGGKRSN